MGWGWGLELLVVLGSRNGNWDGFCLWVRSCEGVWSKSDLMNIWEEKVSVAFGCGGT